MRYIKHLSSLQLFLVFTAIIAFSILCIYVSFYNFDPNYYHYQNIRWNEEYAVVPGLGNFEDRYGFNSNYLLLSAVFSFRFLWGDALYPLQSLVAVLLAVWIILEVIKSKYELKYLLLLVLYLLLFFFYEKYGISNTSTDTIPNLVVFYLMSNLILYPDNFKNKTLLYIFVLVGIVTFKLSMAPLCLISIFILVNMLTEKRYKAFYFVMFFSFSIGILWLIRNVIITGYLVYPLSAVDLFSFDWKMPEEILIRQKEFIYEIAVRSFHYDFGNYFRPFRISGLFMSGVTFFFLAIISLFVVLFQLVKKKKATKYKYIIYITLLLHFIYWYIGAPDFRFGLGIIFSLIFFAIVLLIPNDKINLISRRKIIIPMMLFSSILMFTLYASFLKSPKHYYNGLVIRNVPYPFLKMLVKPYPMAYRIHDDQVFQKMKGEAYSFVPYSLSKDITIYISTHHNGFSFDFLPYTGDINIAKEWETQDVKTIEPRGEGLQDGFRPKRNDLK